MEGFSTPWSTKRTASLSSPHIIGLQSLCSAPPGYLPLGPHQAPAPHRIHALLGSPPLRPHRIHAPPRSLTLRCPTPQALLGPSSVWDYGIHTPPGSLPLRPGQATTLQACQINAPPGFHSGRHRRAPNLPKRHKKTGLDPKGVTSEQLRLQFYS
jgi:hypothetical protein